MPPIRFLTTSDGVRIAYCVQGAGPPLVFVRGWLSHIEQAWQDPEFQAYFEPFLRHYQLVRFDMRGNGLSDKEPPALDFAGAVLDLETVMDGLHLEQPVLYGQCFGGPIAIAYAARHPERVSRLILDGTYARGPDVATEKQREDLLTMLREEPQSAMFTLSYLTDPEPQHGVTLRDHYSGVRRDAQRTTSKTLARLYEIGFDLDVTGDLDSITAPTLVMHRRGNQSIPFRLGRELASTIRDARFVALPGAGANPWHGDATAPLAAVGDFLGVGLESIAPPAKPVGRTDALCTILFTDMEASTATTQRLGDAAAQDLVRTHNTIVRAALRENDGREIKHTGDGIMASFVSASRAVDCAIAIQRAVTSGDSGIRVRVGINAGEPVAEEDDLFGTAVQLARRVCDHGQPGQVLASNVVRELTAGKGFLFADQGEIALRGIEDPVRLFEVLWSE